MKKIEIKNAADIYLDDILLIARESNLGDWSRADYQKELSRDDTVFLIALENDKTVGFVSARLITQVMEILNIAVLQADRRKGIGKLLLQAVLVAAKKHDVNECWLELRASNYSAREFYADNKFLIVGERPNYYQQPPENAVLMSLVF